MSIVIPLANDYSSLPRPLREQYVQLIREGTIDSIGKALALWPTAREDAAKVRYALEVIARRPIVRRADCEAERLTEQIAALDRERDQLLAEFKAKREQLAAQRHAAESKGSYRA